MAEEEASHETTTTPGSRPQTAKKDGRKVPGGFDIGDLDDLSPNKESFDASIFANANANVHAQNGQLPSLNPATLPSLPPPTDSSFLYNSSDVAEGNGQIVDEQAMQRHLNDVESSFLPAVSPLGMGTRKDESNPFATSHTNGRLSPLEELNTPRKEQHSSRGPSPPTPYEAYQTPGVQADSFGTGDTTSTLETLSSSPTAAAAARTVSRAISAATIGGYETANDDLQSKEPSEDDGDFQLTPRKQRDTSTGRRTLRHQPSSHSLAVDAGNTPGVALLNRHASAGRRPKYLRSRDASQRSSISSFVGSQDGSEITLGADYALQSGGAVPAFSRNSSMGLARSISLGSMASGIDVHNGNQESSGSLDTLTEEDQKRERQVVSPSRQETPRATSRTLSAPTDTIIARHVRNVQVPESLAKEYRDKSRAASPKRAGLAVSSLGRSRENFTLKEQSNTIERLSKENFDLKLKVMFLSDRLDKLSEEGVKEMISENVELKTGLAVIQRDNKALKRRIKELEKQLQDEEGRPSTAKSGTSHDPSFKWSDQGAQEREEELIYLRERNEEYTVEIEKLRNESVHRENEKRHLADMVRTMGERRGHGVDTREEMDVWKDLLEQETARREQGDEEIRRLRDEVYRLQSEASSGGGVPGLNHTTNIYNITKKRQMSPSRPQSELSGRLDDRNGAFSSASTLVDELRLEGEKLRREVAELQREVGAQASMLTSRNRERDRLYQEQEDLKLALRRCGGSVAGDSILERSVSRAHERSSSRASNVTRQTNLTDNERETFENKQAELRDKINLLTINNQDLRRGLDSCMEDLTAAEEAKKQAEALATELEEGLEVAEEDILTMQSERDGALQDEEEARLMLEDLRKDAQEQIDDLGAQIDEAHAEIDRLNGELSDVTENFTALSNEMRRMSESVIGLEDDCENNVRRIQELEKDLDHANKELEQMEKNLAEANEKIDLLTVQQESSQGEIAFLREEQDGDQMKISDLDAALKNAEKNFEVEKERTKELVQRLEDERRQSDLLATQEQQESQHLINDLNRQNLAARDEIRKLRKNVAVKEEEVAQTEKKLTDLENNIKIALGSLHGVQSNLYQEVVKLRRDHENNLRDLDNAKASLLEKDQLIRQRDSLLETHGAESRKLADGLDKERQAHRATKHQYDSFQITQQRTTRVEQRVVEVEKARSQDQQKFNALEKNLRDQLTERNNLLLNIWKRVSKLCGSDWTHNNHLINGTALPTVESIATPAMLLGFSKMLSSALKKIEALLGDFRVRISSVDKELWKEYHFLDTSFDKLRNRVDRAEALARNAIPEINAEAEREIRRLKDLVKQERFEKTTLKNQFEHRHGVYRHDPSPSPNVPTGPRTRNLVDKTTTTSTLTRHSSSSSGAVDAAIPDANSIRTVSRSGIERSGSASGVLEEKGERNLRMQILELEKQNRIEREGRMLDRKSAKQTIDEERRETERLRGELDRARLKGEMGR